jgi:alkaline phosphatase D
MTPAAALEAFYANFAAPLPQRSEGAPPLPPSTELTRLAFGSCLQQENPAPILSAVAASGAQAFVMLGDNVYGDAYRGDMSLPELREAYQTLAGHPDFETVNGALPIWPVWDDHDFGLNDAGGDFSAKGYAQDIFNAFWRIPEGDPRRARDGVFWSETFGPEGRRVQVILLDTRFFRDVLTPTDDRGAPGKERYLPDADTTKTMLGEAQWAWLKGELDEPADLRIVVSSIQVIADGHGWEAWRTLPHERERLYRAIGAAAGEAPTILVSGDRHAAGLYRHPAPAGGAPLVELTTSSINAPIGGRREGQPDEAGPFRLGERYFPENFGTIEIDWAAGHADLAIHGMDGAAVRQTRVAFGG